MIQKVYDFCNGKELLRNGDRVVAGVSGGADSLCLLLLLCELQKKLQLELFVVHVHHGIRGRAADEDLEFVRELCKKHNIPFFPFWIDVPKLAKSLHLSEEEAGRNERYRLFEEVRRETGSQKIAVAHHMDDLAETSMMNLLRGSGIRGVSGILPKRDNIIRPLLCLRRSEIEAWLLEQDQRWCTDFTNMSDDYFRNRVRNRLLPELCENYNERSIEHIAAFAADLQEMEVYFSNVIQKILTEEEYDKSLYACLLSDFSQNGIYISKRKLEALPHFLQAALLREAIRQMNTGLRDVSRIQIETIIELIRKPGCSMLSLPRGLKVYTEYGAVFLTENTEKESGICPKNKNSFSMRIFLKDNEKKGTQSGCTICFDYDKIKGALKLRARQNGDWICVDAQGGRKKLKDVLIDSKIPLRVRETWPLFACGSEIMWIPGIRQSQSALVDEHTRWVLEIKLA